MDKTLYIKASLHVKVTQGKVQLKDVAEIFCPDEKITAKAKTIVVARLKKPGDRQVLSILWVLELISGELPAVTPESIGETDIILEWEKPNKLEIARIAFVSGIAFFGTAFTIMAFHNDINIRGVFEEVYRLTSGRAPEQLGVLEWSYCLGIFVGITVFFNHLGKKKFTKDPTPVTVAMYNYEKDVNRTVVEQAERGGTKTSV